MTVIAGDGTPESRWLPWLDTLGAPRAEPPAAATGRGRAVVLAAHPDDEVLAAGGLLHTLARSGWRTDLVWATDGEASHPGSTALTPARLARRRRAESMAARAVLGLRGTVAWLALPDSGLAAHAGELAGAFGVLARGADLLLSPWRDDGHPDHDVCGRVAAGAAARLARPLWELPVWAWHWADPADLTARWQHAALVPLDAAARTVKAAAVRCFATQVEPLGAAPADAAVLPPAVLARFARPVEVVLCTPGGTG